MESLVVLFDIDLTLVDVQTDRDVLRDVIGSLAGSDSPLIHLDPTGQSDWWVVTQLGVELGQAPADLLGEYEAAYGPRLEVALRDHPPSVLPGAESLLRSLTEGDAVAGIATGNLRANAHRKLRHAGLDSYFLPLRGGFGDRLLTRTEIVAAAKAECSSKPSDRIFYVADTEFDMRAATQARVVPIGVATGRYSEQDLLRAGAADAYTDLSGVEAMFTRVLEDAAS